MTSGDAMPGLESLEKPISSRRHGRLGASDGPVPAAAELHQRLADFNRQRLRPAMIAADWREQIEGDAAMRLVEAQFVERERAAVAPRAASAPCDPAPFVAWFEALEQNGPGQGDRLFPYLAERATYEEMRWFLAQEVAGEAGFDDLVALTQVGFPVQAKLELARNYWDEMGRGNRKGMHGPMLHTLARALAVVPVAETTVWQSLALNNLMIGLAANRRYAFQSIGALGAIELTAPGRAAQVSAGLRRLGVPAKARHYFELHAVLDVKHSQSWNREILRSLVADQSQAATAIAEGALLRLSFGERCFRRYRAQFGLTGDPAATRR
jgi:hypothetical protein